MQFFLHTSRIKCDNRERQRIGTIIIQLTHLNELISYIIVVQSLLKVN